MLVSDLFRIEPTQWGLRGDPHLWADMQNEFEISTSEITVSAFKDRLEVLYEEKTGVSIQSDESPYVERYAHGGMSSGHVCTSTWRERLIPYLVDGLKKMKEADF